MADPHGNPSAGHWAGRPARERLDAARARVAALIGCAPGEIVFTSGGSEANNLILKSVFERAAVEHPHFVTTAVEHPATPTGSRSRPCSPPWASMPRGHGRDPLQPGSRDHPRRDRRGRGPPRAHRLSDRPRRTRQPLRQAGGAHNGRAISTRTPVITTRAAGQRGAGKGDARIGSPRCGPPN